MHRPTGLFRVDTDAKTLDPLDETDLAAHGLRERYDLQEWVEKHPQVLEEGLLVISKECSSFDCTNERADLVALDKMGNIVVIELKRDDSGTDVHWQAIKYASYFARAVPEDILRLLCDYKSGDLNMQSAERLVLDHTQLDDVSLLNREQRIILASHRFAREVTCAVLWLTDRHDVDIKCVQLTPFADPANGGLYLQSRVIIPVPGTEGLVVGIGRPSASTRARARFAGVQDDVTRFMSSVVQKALGTLSNTAIPDRWSRWAGTWNSGSDHYRFYKVWYSHFPWENHAFSYQTHIVHHANGETNFTIKFEINLDSAEQRGLSPDQIAALRAKMQEYAEQQGLQVQADKAVRVEHIIPMSDMDDTLRDRAAPLLAGLIEYFTPAVDEILAEDNEEDAPWSNGGE